MLSNLCHPFVFDSSFPKITMTDLLISNTVTKSERTRSRVCGTGMMSIFRLTPVPRSPGINNICLASHTGITVYNYEV